MPYILFIQWKHIAKISAIHLQVLAIYLGKSSAVLQVFLILLLLLNISIHITLYNRKVLQTYLQYIYKYVWKIHYCFHISATLKTYIERSQYLAYFFMSVVAWRTASIHQLHSSQANAVRRTAAHEEAVCLVHIACARPVDELVVVVVLTKSPTLQTSR